MKTTFRLIITLFILLNSLGTQAQSFYEAQFSTKGINYYALVIFYDDNDVLIRTRYMEGETFKVAEFKATAQITTTESGADCYLIDGTDAKLVYGDDGTGYSADNFIFYSDDEGGWKSIYALDDNGWEADNATELMSPAKWEQLDPEVAFTQKFVFNYFDKTDPLYNVLLAYNPDNIVDIDGVNGNHEGEGDGEWEVVMSKGTGFGEQSWVTRIEFPEKEIGEYWDESKSITDMSYGNGLWLVSMSKNSGFGSQAYKYGASWPNEWIEKQWDQTRRVTEVAYGNGIWAVVMSKSSGYTKQIYSVSKEWLDVNWKNGTFSITSVAYGAGHWVVVLSEYPDKNPSQRIRAAAEFPGADVKELWAEGFDISTMAYGDEWVVIMTAGLELTQSFDFSTDFPKPYVKEKWDAGYSISEAVYTYNELSTNFYLNFTGTASTSGNSNNTIAETTTAVTTTNTTTTITAVPRLHLITVANTKVPDIGVSCAIDRDNISNEFADITSGLGIELITHVVDGANLTKAKVKAAIDGVNVKSNDIVVFIYTGHGYRWSDQASKYPQMALYYSRYDSPSKANSYNLESVYDLIVAKGARLNIVLGDCCNSDIGVTSREGGGGLASRSYTRGSTDRLRKLFFEAEGDIIAAAAKPNETSCGSRTTGGYFLNAFFSAIDKEVSYTATGSTSWDAILSRSMSSATYKTQNLNGCSIQHGVYKGL
jgi:hypothetical protein